MFFFNFSVYFLQKPNLTYNYNKQNLIENLVEICTRILSKLFKYLKNLI